MYLHSWSSGVQTKNPLRFAFIVLSTIKHKAVTMAIVPKKTPKSRIIPKRNKNEKAHEDF